jgi:hypothetical protein
MIAFIRRLWAAAPLATALLVLALAATLVFGTRSALFWAGHHARIGREQPVAAWMTPGYVAHSWHVPRDVVIEALSLDRRDGPPRASLADIAAERDVPVAALIDRLEDAIAAHRAAISAPGGRLDTGDEPSEERTDGREPGE